MDEKKAIVSLRAVAFRLRVSPSKFRELAETAGRYYGEFPLKKGDKVRLIRPSQGPLKELQRKIDRRILKAIPLPACVQGGVSGRSPLTNAEVHLRSRFVIRLDIVNFFDNVTCGQVFEMWRSLGYSPRLARWLTKLTTYRRSLPQGAPSSTSVANLILAPVDQAILRAVEAAGVSYSRFVDDLALSGEFPQQFIPVVVRELQKSGFRVKRRKLAIQPRYHRQELTGLVLNHSLRASSSRTKRDAVRHQILSISDFSESSQEMLSIRGKISNVRLTNRGAAARLDRLVGRQRVRSQARFPSGMESRSVEVVLKSGLGAVEACEAPSS